MVAAVIHVYNKEPPNDEVLKKITVILKGFCQSRCVSKIKMVMKSVVDEASDHNRHERSVKLCISTHPEAVRRALLRRAIMYLMRAKTEKSKKFEIYLLNGSSLHFWLTSLLLTVVNYTSKVKS